MPGTTLSVATSFGDVNREVLREVLQGQNNPRAVIRDILESSPDITTDRAREALLRCTDLFLETVKPFCVTFGEDEALAAEVTASVDALNDPEGSTDMPGLLKALGLVGHIDIRTDSTAKGQAPRIRVFYNPYNSEPPANAPVIQFEALSRKAIDPVHPLQTAAPV